ncbi:non-homologous end-joining DNA ligase [Rhodoplanes sp. Z2-YC6860]|uniref:non-homologous end-joining DNA ligase n=1 Tax=Rhodoplanes sp. Z2-YC6860 TaxID=674703 RepID=UPI00078EF458|nr:non-homologous end-joining DNA ligase [Rhodoplanes sp. Z2-YC6860]AMN40176.1 DNA polymerase LigD, ligase domain-containing protein [Rhodoplanes sp. Z2-YC6860]
MFVKPQLATLFDGFPSGNWVYEIKFDGYRMQVSRSKGKSKFYTRSGLDWLNRFAFIKDGLGRLPPDIIIDGEVVSVEPSGRTNFSQLQADLKSGRQDRLTFYAFDILRLGQQDLRPLPLLERKLALEMVLKNAQAPGIIFSEHETGVAKKLFERACEMGLEGLIAKRPDASYRSERNDSWLKLKCVQTDQFFVVGYVPASRGRGVGALRLATKDMKYAGKVGTGFSDKVSLSLQQKLDRISVDTAPIKIARKRNTTWVEPKFVAKVAYRDITDDGLLRHASFKGLA